MKPKTFIVGAIIVSLGVVLFFYVYSNIQALGLINDRSFYERSWYVQKQHSATIFQYVGIGLIAMAVLITATAFWLKKRAR